MARMTHSQMVFRENMRDLAYQAIVNRHKKKLRGLKQVRHSIPLQSHARGLFLFVSVVAIGILAYNVVSSGRQRENPLFKPGVQADMGRGLASLLPNSGGIKKVRVVFLFNKSNRRYAPFADSLVSGLRRMSYEIQEEWPMDRTGFDEDDLHLAVRESLGDSSTASAFIVVAPGGIGMLANDSIIPELLEAGRQVVVFGDLSGSPGMLALSRNRNCVLVARRTGQMESFVGGGSQLKPEPFVLPEYVVLR